MPNTTTPAIDYSGYATDAEIANSACVAARRGWLAIVNTREALDTLDHPTERLLMLLTDNNDSTPVQCDPEATWPEATPEYVLRALGIYKHTGGHTDEALRIASGCVAMFGNGPSLYRDLPRTAEYSVMFTLHLRHLLAYTGRHLRDAGLLTIDPAWDDIDFARYGHTLGDIRRHVTEHGPRDGIVEFLIGIVEFLIGTAEDQAAVNEPETERTRLCREHALHLLKAGHSLSISMQVASTIEADDEWPEGLGLQQWASKGLGRPGGVRAIRYDFASLTDDRPGWTQVRPDMPPVLADGSKGGKYLDAERKRLMVHPIMAERHRAGTASKVRLVEGTNQALCAVHLWADDPDVLVIGLPSCTGWCSDGYKPVPDLMEVLRPANITEVHIVMDADVAKNPSVNEAARRLAAVCRMERKKVRHVRLDSVSSAGKGGDKDGFDDYIAATYPLAGVTLKN